MTKWLIALAPGLRSFLVQPIADERPGGWYRPEGEAEWFGPGSYIKIIEMDTNDQSSRGNPEFKSGDLVEVWDFMGLGLLPVGREVRDGKICTYVRILPGRREVEVLLNGNIHVVSRRSICPVRENLGQN